MREIANLMARLTEDEYSDFYSVASNDCAFLFFPLFLFGNLFSLIRVPNNEH